jgi:hypothetical protein
MMMLPRLAHFAASPPTSPRTVYISDIAPPIPFPFNPLNIDANDALLRDQSTVSDNLRAVVEQSTDTSQSAVSDNMRAVVSVHDVLHSGIHHEDLRKPADRSPTVSDSVLGFNPLYEDLRKHADLLLTMHQSAVHNSQVPA